MNARVASTQPEVKSSSIIFKDLEEEVWDGCTLQHGEMSDSGLKIHYVEAGDPAGQLVVLVHGFPNLWFVWRNQFKPLVEAGYHLIALDLRGFNLSCKPESLQSYTRSAVLSDIEKLVDKFGAGNPAIMVGHDWGATISWCFTEDYPSKVTRLVASNCSRFSDMQKMLNIRNYRQIGKSWYFFFFQLPWVPEWVLSQNNYSGTINSLPPSATDEDKRRHLESFLGPGGLKGGISYYRAGYRGLWGREDRTVPVVSTPVTVIWGDQDPFLLPNVADTDKEKAPNANIVHLPKSGHWPMWDEPVLYNQLLLKAISGDGEASEK